eukprot:c4007_g1_i1.p1 GENE.c4007_g1_i1~~c4007_g1_i1.p1  ORF type:complete len:354 (-),score=96.54 c4007_g1_i1:56-1117(-)
MGVASRTQPTQMEGSIFGMGNPLLDISAVVPKSFFEKYDVKPNNAILAEEKHLPMYQELTDNFEVSYIAGGATQNTMRVAQWFIQSPPHVSTYVGCVGKDRFGQVLEDVATKDKVKVHYMKIDDVPTGTCAVLIDQSERSLVANISAAGKFVPDHLTRADTTELMHKAKVFYIEGYFLTVSPASIMHIAQFAAQNNKLFSMNLAAPFVSQFFFEPLMQAMPYVDFLFGNESEALAFAASHKWETTEVREIAAKAADLPRIAGSKPRVVVFTQGSSETVVATAGSVTAFPVPLVSQSEIVDLNGAGDAFCGGFLAQLVRGKDLAECVNAGHYAAGVVIRCSGCSFPEKPDYDLQ